ncbi:MAG: ArsA family ATPase [Bdellovibrionales bacterium]
MACWLKPLKVVVCAGTGGVGKTTMAAAMAWGEANQGRRVLVLTIDPARRLADALGIQLKADEQSVKIPGTGELTAAMIDAQAVFTDFVRRASPNPQVSERLLHNRLFKELSSSLSGSQEFTSLERLLVAVESGRFDLIVLDTPPTQHAIDFLRAPERIFSLFQDSVTRWFTQPDGQGGVLRQVFNRGTKTVLSALERLTGRGFLTELSEFFIAAAEIQSTVAARSIAVHRLLAQADTGFALVTAFDEAKMKEATDFAADLRRSGHSLKAVIINRALPLWLKDDSGAAVLATGDETLQRLEALRLNMAQYYHRRDIGYTQMIERLHGEAVVLSVPEEKQSIEGVVGLSRIAEHLQGEKT